MTDVAGQWIKAHVLAACIYAVASLSLYGLKQAIVANDPNLGYGAVLVFALAALILHGFSGAVEGVLTGAVLQRIAPALPRRTWIALYVAIGIVLAISAIADLPAATNADSRVEANEPTSPFLLGLIAGGIYGTIMGGLQALVLRKATHGLSIWIAWSAAAGVIIGLIWAMSPLRGQLSWGWKNELVDQATEVALLVLMSVVMLPAVFRLRPHSSSVLSVFE